MGAAITAIGMKIFNVGMQIPGPFSAVTQQFAQMGQEMTRAAAITGMTVEEMSGLKYVAQQAGVEFGAMQHAIGGWIEPGGAG